MKRVYERLDFNSCSAGGFSLKLGPLRVEALRFPGGFAVIASWRRWRLLGGLAVSGWRVGWLPRREGEALLPGPNGVP